MIRRVLVFLSLSSALCLGQAPGGEEKKPKPPPTPKEYAQQLLDGVREMAGAADPQVSPFILWRAADAYIAVDKKKAAEMYCARRFLARDRGVQKVVSGSGEAVRRERVVIPGKNSGPQ